MSQIARRMNEVRVPQLEDQFEMPIYGQRHHLTAQTRACLIDWMLQVLRVLNKTSVRTFFMGASILDRFFEKQAQSKNRQYHQVDIHLYGLVSFFIASKLEETQPISMESVLFDAGKGKFQHAEIVYAERQIFQVLDYKMLSETLIDRVFQLLDEGLNFLNQMHFKGIDASQRKDLEMMLNFVSKALLHDFKLCSLPL